MTIEHRGTEPLQTQRLKLRRFTTEDAGEMFTTWASDPEVTRYMRWSPHEDADVTLATLTDWVEYYEDPEYYHWAITLQDGTLIGSVGVVNINENDSVGELGYCIGHAYWGKGYTAEAARRVIEYLLREVGLNRIEACHSVKNPASGRVMAKIGMTHEGTARQKYYCNEGFQDSELYGIVKSDLRD